jgi:hypothetical protein
MTRTQAVQRLVNRAEELIDAMRGATNEFDPEVRALQQAIARVEHLLDGGVI